MNARVLLVAKAPVPGRVKTRLGATIGMEAAADLAAAALLDTLDTCRSEFGERCYLALAGDLGGARRGEEIEASLQGWTVFAQQGDGLGERLAHAHRTLAVAEATPVLQIGMDTPQVDGSLLRAALAPLALGVDAVLGPALDGGWWALALADAARGEVLAGVPMSTPGTATATARALSGAGCTVASTRDRLRDVDTVADAVAVARVAPGSRFAHAWTAGSVVAT